MRFSWLPNKPTSLSQGMWSEACGPNHATRTAGGPAPMGGYGYGERDVQFFVPGAEEPLIIQNTPGTFYMGLLTGCEHQVYHVPSAEKLSRFGLPPSSLSVMIRCDLFGRQRLRRKKAPLMANPAFRICIKIFRERFLTGLAASLACCGARHSCRRHAQARASAQTNALPFPPSAAG